MSELLSSSLFFPVALSLLAYRIGVLAQKRFRLALLNPLLVSVTITISALLISGVPYETYREGSRYLGCLLTPSTVCLAIPLYEQLETLKRNLKAVLISVAAGTLSGLSGILLLSAAFGLSHEQYVTLLPKSVTTAIALGISRELGGVTSVTAASVVITGILGNLAAPAVLKLAHIDDPIAKGLAIGTSSHAIGTSKAMEMGALTGAMSSLAIAVSGLMTAIAASFFAGLW